MVAPPNDTDVEGFDSILKTEGGMESELSKGDQLYALTYLWVGLRLTHIFVQIGNFRYK